MTKLIGEKILADYEKAYGLHSCSFRYFNAAGCSHDGLLGENHDPESHLIPLIIRAALNKNKKLKVFGNDYETKDGSCVRDFVKIEHEKKQETESVAKRRRFEPFKQLGSYMVFKAMNHGLQEMLLML